MNNEKLTLVPINVTNASNSKAFLEMLKNEKGEIISAKYVFLVSKESVANIKIQDLILNNKNIDNFSGALIEYDLNNKLLSSKSFKNGLIKNNEVVKIEMKNIEAGQNRPIDSECQDQAICTDWYWVVYDLVTGIIYSSTYLYSSCQCSGLGQSGGVSGGGDTQPGITSTRTQLYEVFRRVNSPGSPENWFMDATCVTTATVFNNRQNNIFTNIANPFSAFISITNPAFGGPFLPSVYPPSTWYCTNSFPTYNLSPTGGQSNQYATMTTTCILTYVQQGGRTELIQRGHTWNAVTDF